MIPLSEAATAFATIVGLVASYKSERASGSWPEFVQWLQEQNHESALQVIEANAESVRAIAALLGTNQGALLGALERLQASVDSLVASSEFGALYGAMKTAPLSAQGLAVVRRLVAAEKGSTLLESNSMDGQSYELFIGGRGAAQAFAVVEPDLLQEDLDGLLLSGLLRMDHDAGGNREYRATRAAYERFRPAAAGSIGE